MCGQYDNSFNQKIHFKRHTLTYTKQKHYTCGMGKKLLNQKAKLRLI